MLAAGRGFGQAAESGGRCVGGIWAQRRAGVSVGGRFAGFYGVARKIGQAGVERFERGESYAAADFCAGGERERFGGRQWRGRGTFARAFQRRRTTVGGESFGRARFSERASGTDYDAGERNRRAGTRSKIGSELRLPRER